MAASSQLAVEARCDLGESPVWDARTATLYFVDINSKRIHSYRPADGASSSIQLDEPVGTIALTSSPTTLLAALQHTVVALDVQSGKVERVVATVPEQHGRDGMRFNDGKVSPQGTFVVGRMHSKWRDGQRGRLYRLDPGSSELVEVLLPEEVHLPNGMDWGRDGVNPVMYFVDSGSETITAYDTDAQGVPVRGEDGQMRARVVSHVPTGHAFVPDGMCLDADGMLWVALGESGSVVCIDPQTGKEVRRVALPVKRPTACTFGGPGLENLYVTTRVETGEGASPHHGAVFALTIPGVRGAAAAHVYPLVA